MPARKLVYVATLIYLALPPAQAQELQAEAQVYLGGGLTCITMLLPSHIPLHQSLGLLSSALSDLQETFDDSGTAYISDEAHSELDSHGLMEAVALAFAWNYRLGDLDEAALARLGPDPWMLLTPQESFSLGEILPTDAQGPHVPIELTLCARTP